MTQSFVIHGKLPSLNEVIDANRANPRAGAKLKRKVQSDIGWAIHHFNLRPMEGPVSVSIEWHEPNRRRDVDNITSAVKFILDALVSCGVLDGDSQRYVPQPPVNHVSIDTFHPRIVVTLEEVRP